MNRVYVYCEKNGHVPFFSFYEELPAKMQQKVWKGIRCRERIRILFRVIFVFDANKDIILLAPFVKQRDRDTHKALERSLAMLSELRQHPECKIELHLGKAVLTDAIIRI